MSRRRRRPRNIAPRTEPYAPVVWQVPEPEDPKALTLYPKKLPGRPTLLTPEVEGRFLGMLMKGIYRNVASEACGLKPDTVEKWIKRGRGRMKDRPPTPEYVGFVRRVEQAEAMARGQVESNIVARSKYDHNAALAWLRTRYPDQWPRFPGGVDEELPSGEPFRAPTAPPMETPPRLAQQTNIIMLDDEKWNELASALIAQQRKTNEKRQAEVEAETVVEQEDPSSGAPRHGRLDALRADSAE